MIVQYLKRGKSPKEIAFILSRSHDLECTEWGIWKIIERHPQARLVYIETYKLRYPEREGPPEKITAVLQAIVQ